MNLFSKSEEDDQAKKELQEKKRKQREKEYEERQEKLRTKSLKEQFIILSTRKEFWLMLFISLVCIGLFVLKFFL